MSRRQAWLSAAGIFALALVVRAVAAAQVPFPVPEDTAYYVGVARNVLEGRGLVSDALWSYQTPPLVVPRPAFEIWLPLPTLLALPSMLLLGTSFGAAQVSSVVVGALVPVLAWRLAADLVTERMIDASRGRLVALGAGVTAALYGPLVLHSALPDSTMPFAVLGLGACTLMARIARDARTVPWTDPRLIGLGALLGLAALTRNEAIWLALGWVIVAWGQGRLSRSERLRLVAVPAVVAVLIFAPWAIRDWAVFGNPLPGQALSNALSRTGRDVFAYQDPPTLSSYLAQGPAKLIQDRVDGFGHNLVTVLLLPAFPVGPIGLLALPWFGRGRTLRPLLVAGLVTFAVTTLLFPVSTTWGTFLHASGPIQVLLLVSCLLALDAGVARVARFRGWSRQNAWLAPLIACLIGLPFLGLTATGIGSVASETQARYDALRSTLSSTGVPLSTLAPIVSDHPVWIAEEERVPTLGLPDEPVSSVLDLARRFGAGALVVDARGDGRWPAILDAAGPGTECFREVHRVPDDPTGSADTSPSDGLRVFLLVCR